jgi:hypothetical protein
MTKRWINVNMVAPYEHWIQKDSTPVFLELFKISRNIVGACQAIYSKS